MQIAILVDTDNYNGDVLCNKNVLQVIFFRQYMSDANSLGFRITTIPDIFFGTLEFAIGFKPTKDGTDQVFLLSSPRMLCQLTLY